MEEDKTKLPAPDEFITLKTYIGYLGIAFQWDLENFLIKFEEKQSLNFSDFAEIWQDQNFSFVFGGQEYVTILRPLIENFFFIIKKFIVFPRSIYTQTGAFYMLYAIYNKQPVEKLCKIRLTLNEYIVLKNLINQLKSQAKMEPLYIYAKLMNSQAFQFVFMKKVMMPELLHPLNSFDYKDDTFKTRLKLQYVPNFQKALNEDDFFKNLKNCFTEYDLALKKLNDNGLEIQNSCIIEKLEEYLNSEDFNDEKEFSEMKERERINTITKIKQKAMKVKQDTRISKSDEEYKNQSPEDKKVKRPRTRRRKKEASTSKIDKSNGGNKDLEQVLTVHKILSKDKQDLKSSD